MGDMMTYRLLHGDNREQLKHLADNSIDSIVCDPPYELGFMGKRWDSTGIAYDLTVWAECLRVLKPGGHLIAFGGTRTYHRMTVAIEDAGFEIRDCIMWLYGSGFPKSLAIDKAIDKQRHDRAQVYQVTAWIREARDNAGLSNRDIANVFGFTPQMADHWTTQKTQPSVPTLEQIPPLLALFGMTLDDVPEDIRTLIWTLNGRKGQPGEAWYQREVVGEGTAGLGKGRPAHEGGFKAEYTLTAPATDLAKQWHGWGTALKPAVEPAVLARKPLTGTVADNVTAWGVGGINVDGCRVSLSDGESAPSGSGNGSKNSLYSQVQNSHGNGGNTTPASGRWPANVILDEDAGEALDEQSDATTSRFFYNVRNEYTCPLCYNTYVKDMTAEELCKSIFASSVENRGWTTRETNECIAHVTALLTQNAQLAQNVKSAIPQCDLCATSIAVALAETKTSGFNQHLCARTLAYMPRFASSILIQNLASFAELWANTDIIPTTQSLSMLYGSALHAIENYIKQENEARAVAVSDRAKATRFLYTSKASKAEREAGLNAPDGQRANIHTTVKPIALMRYLVRLVTPKDGTVLDPFMGSGSTGCAAMCEGVNFVGIELSEEYLEIARRRIEYWQSQNPMGL